MKRMEDSSILRQARQLIESGKEDYICLAINELLYKKYLISSAFSPDEKKVIIAQCESLENWITSMLMQAIDGKSLQSHEFVGDFPSSATYGIWLRHHHPHIFSTNAEYEGRLAWLDWMINECVKQENENARTITETTTIGA